MLKCDERGFELLLTVNHYKYVLKFCNINHGLEARSRLEVGSKQKAQSNTEDRKRKTETGPHSLLSPAKRDLTARRHWGETVWIAMEIILDTRQTARRAG